MATGKKRGGRAGERFRDVARNRRALHEYESLDRLEAGIVLQGTEVKGLRERGATITDAYVQIRDGEAWLINAHISEYDNAGYCCTSGRSSAWRPTSPRRASPSSRCASTSRRAAPSSSSASGAARRSTTSAARSPSATPAARPTGP